MMAKINYLHRCQYVNGDRKSCTEEHRQGRCVDRVGASTAVVKESSLMHTLQRIVAGRRMDRDGQEDATSPVL